MTTIHRVRTEWQDRYHVQLDADAAVLDCFLVELPPYTTRPGMLVYEAGKSLNDLWSEALRMLDFLRAQPRNPVHPATVFVPFGVITARNRADVWREHEIKREMLDVDCTDRDRARLEAANLNDSRALHDRRVASLCRALDLIDGKVQMPATVPWPANLRHLN